MYNTASPSLRDTGTVGGGNAQHSYVELRKRVPWSSLVLLYVTNDLPRAPSSNGTRDGSIARLVLVVICSQIYIKFDHLSVYMGDLLW
jgi:hypothetical protein